MMSRQKKSIFSQSNENEKASRGENNKIKLANVDELTGDDLRESINRVKDNPVEPFAFLQSLADTSTSRVPSETDIDIQLATLSQRIQLNKSLLEKTNNRIKRVNFSEEVSRINDETDIAPLPSGITDVNEALKRTLETLNRMKELISEKSKSLY